MTPHRRDGALEEPGRIRVGAERLPSRPASLMAPRARAVAWRRDTSLRLAAHDGRSLSAVRRAGESPGCPGPSDAGRDKQGSSVENGLESIPMLLSDPVRVHPGLPAAHPTATGWD